MNHGFDIDTLRVDKIDHAVRHRFKRLQNLHPKRATAEAFASLAGERKNDIQQWMSLHRPTVKVATLHRRLEALRALEAAIALKEMTE